MRTGLVEGIDERGASLVIRGDAGWASARCSMPLRGAFAARRVEFERLVVLFAVRVTGRP
jgi:hypothetical protein